MGNVVLKILSLGCGIQSSAIAEMIVEGELPPVDIAIFADTGDEPDYVYEQRDYLKNRLDSVGIDLITVNNGNIIRAILDPGERFASIPAFTDTFLSIGGYPGMLRRQCTHEYKILPIERFIRQTLLKRRQATQSKNGAIRVKKDVSVSVIIGISLDEALRMKESRTKWLINIWPLIDRRMTRLDCVNWLNRKGLPIPEKSSCRICPFHRKSYWRNMKENRQEDWEHVVKIDEWLRNPSSGFRAKLKGAVYLYGGCIPLKDVDFTEDDLQMDFFEMCDGYCFV